MNYGKKHDLPFGIMDVAGLLRLNIRRRAPGQVYVDCPICGDRRGKMNLNTEKDLWRCNYCGEGGGMLSLYAKVYGVSNSDAYREICDALAVNGFSADYTVPEKAAPTEAEQPDSASVQEVHQTISMLLSMLSLIPAHRAHLQSVRGLSDDEITRFGFKSTPPPFLCRSLTNRLVKAGCKVQGVPGFYVDDNGCWTVKFHQRTSGIIPDHVLRWLEQEKIHVSDIAFILDRMSEQQVCNYLQRQKAGTRDTFRHIIYTWNDYLSMADKLGINTNDEIVYRVKLLRQRHDELVEQLRKREKEMEAAATARKYRKIAGICRLIKPKYEYTGEVYSIVVPSGVRDIMREGDTLSHCVGKSDRYWERIEQQEAYILFLRKTAEIDKPYYTLEVEPNGTIRQKQTYFDRQNDDLKDAEKFLKEWQKVVSGRLTESDREKAEKSKALRLQEFEQLRQDDVRIHVGDLAGQRLVDVLVSDLMETAA